MLLYQGHSVYSSFRKEKLLLGLQEKQPAISDFRANYVYFLNIDHLSKEESAQFIRIIDPLCEIYQPSLQGELIWVAPRLGTVSSWSSKATDILHGCGLSKITRIERGIVYALEASSPLTFADLSKITPMLHDRMTQTLVTDHALLHQLFSTHETSSAEFVEIMQGGLPALNQVNAQWGLALSENEMLYLFNSYQQLGRNPSLAELMMFAQINSEHCRHKIFNAQWSVNGKQAPACLFSMIKNTYAKAPEGVLSAYKDNGAVLSGYTSSQLFLDPLQHTYQYQTEPANLIIKVETHNHPSAISPFEGAATGVGGEIRDEGATGVGGKPKAGLAGFSVSNLHIPGFIQPWEQSLGYPTQIASSLDIMLQGPIGAASFNNEFGRPNILGYFRTLETLENAKDNQVRAYGYHKPIMIAGGVGQIRSTAVQKQVLPVGAKLVVLGGPAMLIGLGGGAASSSFAGSGQEELDYASVQRSNPEMQRRCQEVINACWALEKNPIISIHDVGAGGLANALSELIHDSNRGADLELRAMPTADTSLNAMEIWCNESQERYVLAIEAQDLACFTRIAQRERCPFAVVGQVNDSAILKLHDEKYDENPVDLPLQILFGEAGKTKRTAQTKISSSAQALSIDLPLSELIQRVLQLPAVADKKFLITIADRTVTGMVARDQMIGPWQVPVADVAVTASSYGDYTGEAMAMGERAPIALLDPLASVRMAIGEAITNIVAAKIKTLSDIKLSANWMASVHKEDDELYAAVKAVGMELCPALGICIPVGKDSLSMQMKWQHEGTHYEVSSPLSLIISAFAPVMDITSTLTPELEKGSDARLMLIDLGNGKNRLGGSALAQVTQQWVDLPPDLDDPQQIKNFFKLINTLRDQDLLSAYHDRSDGGLLATLCEMSFASHVGISVDLAPLGPDPIASLFSEELGAVIQFQVQHQEAIFSLLKQYNLLACAHIIGKTNALDQIILADKTQILFQAARIDLHRYWSETSYRLQALRDNPLCARQEYDGLLDAKDPGLSAHLTFTVPSAFPAIHTAAPKVAILREQGVNGHYEMAAAFSRAGFLAIDVHMTDLLQGEVDLKQFQGLVACGGFSYGDVLGAGRGWANSILYNPRVRDQFTEFFNLPSIFVLGVCNGCQMLSHLKALIPGAQNWPYFGRNVSEQFEARLSLVKISKTPSIFFQDMAGSVLPIAVSHGEGKTLFTQDQLTNITHDQQIVLQYVDNYAKVTEGYPANPNGSELGIGALTNQDGRFTIMMPHPERVFRSVQFSWRPKDWHPEHSPWIKMFMNARKWV